MNKVVGHKEFDLAGYRQQMEAFVGKSEESQVFWDALDLAVDAHSSQWRKSGDPYIVHPCSVATILARELDIYKPEILAAALLHDTVEDVDYVTVELLEKKFGLYVAAIVEGCTKVKNYSGSKQSFKKLVHRKIFSGAAGRPEVMLVKLADRLHNLRTLSSMPHHKRQRIADETLNIYAPLATILGLFSIKRELYNISLDFKFPRQGKKVRARIKRLYHDENNLMVVNCLQKALDENQVEAKVELRVKGLWAYYDLKNRILLKEIENPQEMLITAANREECYKVLGTLNYVYPPVPRTIRDFIANPKPTGYQGLHARANIGGRKYLFKIRTEDMGRKAQRGLVREWLSGEKSSEQFVNHIQEMFDILGRDDSISYSDMIVAGGRKEIYTYTPKGDLVCLPINSRVLDFAFRVHTEIGHTCIGAVISREKVLPDYKLRDGDVVNIICQAAPVSFDLDTQKLCQTPKARSELAKTFRQRWEKVAVRIGESVLSQEMLRYGIPFELLAKEEADSLLNHFNLANRDELFLKIGEGRLLLREVITEVKKSLYADRETLYQPTGIFNKVALDTLDPVIVKSSACCRPSPLDKGIVGLLSERGLSLHKKDCRQLQRITFQREDAVEVRWHLKNTRVEKTQKIVVSLITRQKLLMLLSVAPEEMHIVDITLLNPGNSQAQSWEVKFTVANLDGLKKIVKHFSRNASSSEKNPFSVNFSLQQ